MIILTYALVAFSLICLLVYLDYKDFERKNK